METLSKRLQLVDRSLSNQLRRLQQVVESALDRRHDEDGLAGLQVAPDTCSIDIFLMDVDDFEEAGDQSKNASIN